VRDKDGNTPLLIAACYSHLSVVQYLCEQGADKEARENSGYTPLHQAVHHGRLSVVQYHICEQGVDKDATDNNGNTSLHLAAQGNYLTEEVILKESMN
jgi:ankyrin repeat protein